LLTVKIAEFRNSPLLVGQHFQVQVSITFQKSGVDGQLKPVVSLLPVDLYFLLLPHYGVFDRHTIKLTLALWSSQGFPHSQGSFAWVVQVRASSSSATTTPASNTITPAQNVSTSSSFSSASGIGPASGDGIKGKSDGRSQNASKDAVSVQTPASFCVSNGLPEKLCLKSFEKTKSSINLVSSPPATHEPEFVAIDCKVAGNKFYWSS
jgi:hypothetical protein